MEENYVGYLLKALDAEEHEAVERALHEQPAEQAKLELLQRALAPLEADRAEPAVPAGLWVRTLSRIAEHKCNSEEETQAAPAPAILRLPHRSVGGGRPVWRRADLLVAASIFLCVGLLIPPGLAYLHFQHDKVACKDNMRVFYNALSTYGDAHDGELPNVTSVGTDKGVAGMVVPILYDSGHLDDEFQCRCPGNAAPSTPRPHCVPLDKLKHMTDEQFDQVAPHLAGCYAYTLGFKEAGQYHPHRLGKDKIPILSDRPPLGIRNGDTGNSPNHGGRGQNVLLSDGSVEFRTSRFNDGQDDIYLNHDNQVGAGKDRLDAVLGDSSARP